ncbi:PP2C family protein-serine/threonine phosphatase [Streptomyces sp. bgisy034]|uniref:PP2C family protein-serine/threonine phosphatase n=1 Tax=Streptomyces sp. bgisy034 TaxID=3413774 RepID=UPI003EB8AADF
MLTLGRSDESEAFPIHYLALLEDIARRIGRALENARHYQRRRQVGETTQRYLLPQLPHLPGVGMTAHYLSAPEASYLGGDPYDAFHLPGGDTALVIGEVAGHDLEAAAAMAQLRNMIRAFTSSKDQPTHRIGQHLNEAMTQIADLRMATMILARLAVDAAGAWHLRWSSAGHPPPLLVGRDGLPPLPHRGQRTPPRRALLPPALGGPPHPPRGLAPSSSAPMGEGVQVAVCQRGS